MTDTIASLAARHRRDEKELFLRRLDENDWAAGATAAALGVHASMIARLIAKHDMREVYNERRRRPGRVRIWKKRERAE